MLVSTNEGKEKMSYIVFGLLSVQLGFDLVEFRLDGAVTSNKAAEHHIALGQTEKLRNVKLICLFVDPLKLQIIFMNPCPDSPRV